jgi:hypothetical protein
MCQEISQYKPTVVEVTANVDDQTYQGTAAARDADNSAAVAEDGNAILALSAMKYLLATVRQNRLAPF